MKRTTHQVPAIMPARLCNGGRPRNLPLGHKAPHDHDEEPDLDLVEAAFVEGFEAASDPTSFLRLARIPFVSERGGQALHLLRVEITSRTDVASITPLLGGSGHRVAPLPASHIGRRRSLAFHYLAGSEQLGLSLAEARSLPDLTPPR
jgi:hypothetical protein